MRFTKLNLNWDADPNVPLPEITVENNKIILVFRLNYFIHNNVSKDDMGILEFYDCYKFRLGEPNDEGFYRNQFRFSFEDAEWGNFYVIEDSNWEKDFPADGVVLNEKLKGDIKIKHFLFYFREETFECIAKDFSFKIAKGGINYNLT